jgi:hypothetical protein
MENKDEREKILRGEEEELFFFECCVELGRKKNIYIYILNVWGSRGTPKHQCGSATASIDNTLNYSST